MTSLVDLSAVEQRRLIGVRAVSARELLDAHLDRIDELNPAHNAVVAMDRDVAYRRAAAIDEANADGQDLGPLAGLVTAHKDLTETADFVTSYGTTIFAGQRARADSLLVGRMKSAGAVAVGKTNTPEWGAGSHTFNPVYGATGNAVDPARSAGGSSGGAAVALALGMVAIADGSDMGGSLRNPAAWNGVVGFRPSRGVVPDVDPGNGWSTLAVDGPMARTVDDLYLLTRVLAQPDWRDPMCRAVEWPSALTPPERPLRVAFSPTLGGLPVDSGVASVVAAAAARLEELGWSVELAEPDFSGVDEAFETLRSLVFAAGIGAAAGQRLGELKWTIQDEVARGRAMDPGAMPAALGRQRVFWERAVAIFDRFDLLVAPVTQCAPFPIAEEYPTAVADTVMERYITWMRSCSRVTMLGMPAMSLPCGTTPDGLPVGLQLIGGPWGDLNLLRAARAAEPVLTP